MLRRYLDRGDLYLLEEEGAVRGVCLVTDEGDGVLEIKNLAVEPAFQGRGLGRALIQHVADTYRGRFSVLQVGTGDSPATLPFYEACGFSFSHLRENFFADNYPRPIWEGGRRLVHMVCLRRPL